MDLVCFNCKKSWDVSQAHILGAKLKFALGFKEQAFVCPNCNTKNVINKETFEAELAEPPHAASPAPAASKPAAPAAKPAASPQPLPKKPIYGSIASNAPVVGAGPAMPKERHGTVVVRSLRVRKDHNTHSDILAGLSYGEKVTVISTWADGDDVWAQLGPDRWAAVVYNGEALIELSD